MAAVSRGPHPLRLGHTVRPSASVWATGTELRPRTSQERSAEQGSGHDAGGLQTGAGTLAPARDRPGRSLLSPDRLRRQRRRLRGGLCATASFCHSSHCHPLGERPRHAGSPQRALCDKVGNVAVDTSPGLSGDGQPPRPQDVSRAPLPSPTARETPLSATCAFGPGPSCPSSYGRGTTTSGGRVC